MDGFEGWYEDFWELGSDRQIGMALGPIPAASIDRHVAGWPYQDADMFRTVIRAMDRAYLELTGKTDGDTTAGSGTTETEGPATAEGAFWATFGSRAPRSRRR